jgi:MerR family redox-sensitive transcriptional activator SoxR
MVLSSYVTIGEAAKSVGVAVSTVRYYDELGLIPNVARIGGKRHFDQESVQRLAFIQRCKSVGLSLDEIRTILDDKSASWHDLVANKIVEITERRDSFTKMISQLEAIKDCDCIDPVQCARCERG